MDTAFIDKIENDVRNLKIQGATNVALAVIDVIEKLLNNNINDKNQIINFAKIVAYARPNEPLAQNIFQYIQNKDDLKKAIFEYKEIINNSKEKIKNNTIELLKEVNILFTHCHSSTTTNAIIGIHNINPNLIVVNTETRPLMQGHITSKELLAAGINTFMITDPAASQFILDDKFMPVDAVLIGCDEILNDGSILNKTGSLNIALASFRDATPLYVMSPLLKFDLQKSFDNVVIEYRSPEEIWKESPSNLVILNPAFDKIPVDLITGFITEIGLIKPSEIATKVKENYPWL